jgi:SAM-dependent methyltransferase
MTTYDEAFFNYINTGSIRSARQLLPVLTEQLEIGSVLDVGCGQGAWLSVWEELGVDDCVGVDGPYVDQKSLLVDERRFVGHDLTTSLDLGRSFDLVQSLEVAEHLPASRARQFVRSLTRHGSVVLFSAAPKGQGGDHHINEQSYDYWRRLFEEFDFLPFDYVRPKIYNPSGIEKWYRYNTLLYVHRSHISTLAPAVAETLVDRDTPIADVSPLVYRARKLFFRAIPLSLANVVAKLKHWWIVKARASS